MKKEQTRLIEWKKFEKAFRNNTSSEDKFWYEDGEVESSQDLQLAGSFLGLGFNERPRGGGSGAKYSKNPRKHQDRILSS